MPIESIGLDVKMSIVDIEPKTYSPMSGSDENMSSPPSVLTTASAGSCTPSSLPSAGSTPSSIPSAGSTPYQFVSQEESTVIKPLTPSDHHSLHSSTPDQPVTPETSVPSYLPATEFSDIGTCKKNLLSGIDNTVCMLSPSNEGATISEDVNERREDCPCIMCDDKQTLPNSSCKGNDASIHKPLEIFKSKNNKGKSSKEKDGDSIKSRKKNKHKTRLYQSEISQDPQSTSIKIKIKLTSTTTKHRSTLSSTLISPLTTTDSAPLNSLSILPDSLSCSQTTSVKSSKGKRSAKRKSSEISDVSSSQVVPVVPRPKRKRNKTKPLEPFENWGPILPEVNGETQSAWGCSIPHYILEKIFLVATHTDGCIPFLLRVSKVCRLWREVSVHPQLWHTADLATSLIKPRFRNEKKLMWLLENRLSQVEDLSLAGWTEAITPLMLRRISELCPKLKSLNLAHCYHLHAENLHSLLYSSINLQCLDLTGIMGSHRPTLRCAVGQQTLSEIAASAQNNLTNLTLADNTLSNVPSIIATLSDHCHHLQVLDISNVTTVGGDNVKLDIEILQSGCPRLKILRLVNSRFRLSQTSLSVQASSPGFPELEELGVAADDRLYSGMNDAELERILKNSHKLRLLDVRGCHNITDSSLVRIPPFDLEHLFLAGGSMPRSYSDRLELVIRKWQHSLVELDLSWTSATIDAALYALADEKNEQLRILNLCGSSMNFGPVRQVLKNCTHLEKLNLTSCRALPRGMKRLYESVFEIDKLRESIGEGKFDDPPPDA